MFGLGLLEWIFLCVFLILPLYLLSVKKTKTGSTENKNIDIENIKLFRMNFKRFPSIGLYILSSITILVFQFYWNQTRINSLNKMTKYKINIAWNYILILFPIAVFVYQFLELDILNFEIVWIFFYMGFVFAFMFLIYLLKI